MRNVEFTLKVGLASFKNHTQSSAVISPKSSATPTGELNGTPSFRLNVTAFRSGAIWNDSAVWGAIRLSPSRTNSASTKPMLMLIH